MKDVTQPNSVNDSNNDYFVIEEFKTLRAEISRLQDARLFILAFTITSIGTILGVTLKDVTDAFQGQQVKYFTVVMLSFALVVVIVALLLTAQQTQQIDRIGGYIRVFIETRIEGLKWETRWDHYRGHSKNKAFFQGILVGGARALALYYAFITISIYVSALFAGLYASPAYMIIVSLLAITALAFELDLYTKKSKSWKIDWALLSPEEKVDSSRTGLRKPDKPGQARQDR